MSRRHEDVGGFLFIRHVATFPPLIGGISVEGKRVNEQFFQVLTYSPACRVDTNVDVQSFVSAERFASLHAVNINGSEPSSEAVHGIKYRWMKVPEGISPCPAHHVLDELGEVSRGKVPIFFGVPPLAAYQSN